MNLKSEIKEFLAGGFSLLSSAIMWIPINWIRDCWCKLWLASMGNHSNIRRHVEILSPHRVKIGNYTGVNKGVLLDGRGGELRIGDNVDIARDARIWTLQHDYNSVIYEAVGAPVTIGDYVWIGAGATILPGVTIGEGAVIATCAVVTKDVPPYTVYAGIPAKKIAERKVVPTYNCGKRRWFQ